MLPRAHDALLTVIALLLGANLLSGRPLLGAAVAHEAPPTHDVLRARLIELVNSNGQSVAQLYTGDDGAGNLRLRTAQGEVRVKLGATADGGALIVMNRSTEPAAWLSVDPQRVALRLLGPQGASRLITP